ncbi:hypothetical protein EDC01DRAFT_713635 [Geopyxis carbonaria]|nr:hypothetical protein EDC01DRAFT_713635 [Geopyxis carbonaria]
MDPDEDESVTPLLGPISHTPNLATSIFLEVTESPWDCINHDTLLFLRTLVSVFMSVIYVLHFLNEMLNGHGGIFPFLLGNLTWLGQLLYMWMTCYWTYISTRPTFRLFRYGNMGESRVPSFLRTSYWQDLRSFPDGGHKDIFCTFYMTTATLPPVSTWLYWTCLHPIDLPLRTEDILQAIINTVNVPIALTEILVLNSVTSEYPLWVHIPLLFVGTVIYCDVWVLLGNQYGEPSDGSKRRDGWLDKRFFGGAEGGTEHGYKVVWTGLAVVGLCWAVQWLLHIAKGLFIAAARRRRMMSVLVV